MKLWVESACKAVPEGGGAAVGATGTLITEDRFVATMVGGRPTTAGRWAQEDADRLCQQAGAGLVSDIAMDQVVAGVLAALPAGEHLPVAVLRIGREGQAELAEIDAPPLFMARKGDFLLLPVVEEEQAGRLVRRCNFTVQAGDHLALVTEGYLGTSRAARWWGWRDVALSVRRLTATGCDAEQLAGALARIANRRIDGSGIPDPQSPISVLALFVRPMRTATVWSGPPADPRQDREALARLLDEEGVRIICGDTTAEIAARLLGGRLVIEPPPAEGWTEVPPTSRLVGATERVDLITEGAVTLRVASGRLAQARRPRDLAGRADGASRLAKLLLEADKVTLIEGQAVNPAQRTADGAPMRRAAVAGLVEALQAQGKMVVVEHM